MINLKKFFKDKKVLITGHTGFKGSWLTTILLNFGARVTGVALRPHTDPNLFEALLLEQKIENYFLDIRNSRALRELLKREKPEIVFHLAAQTLVRVSYDKPLDTIEVNTLGTANVLESLRQTPSVTSAVIITTDKVYENKEDGQPYRESDALGGHDLYSASKAAADIITNSYRKSFGLPVAVARAGNVIAGGDWGLDRLLPDIVRATFQEKTKVSIRNPGSIRPWQHVLEPLYGYLLLAQSLYEKKPEASGPWNFGPDESSFVSVENLIKKSKLLLNTLDYEIVPDPTKHEARLLKLDSSKAKRLGWVPQLSLDDTLRLTIEWYRQYYEGIDPKEITDAQITRFFS